MHVSLTPKLVALVRAKVDSGLYNNSSEVIREALRLMQEHDEIGRAKLARLKRALAEGEDDATAGRISAIDSDRELAEFFAKL